MSRYDNVLGAKSDTKIKNILRNHTVYNRVNNFNGMYRYGRLDTEGTLTGAREFVFFTKPDLCIVKGTGSSKRLADLAGGLDYNPFFMNLYSKYPNVIKELQYSASGDHNPFSFLLFNCKKPTSNLDVPSLSAKTIDIATNQFGTNYEYRGSSEADNDNFNISIEFEDNRFLDSYMFFRAYDEYETLKSHGRISYPDWYINKYIVPGILADAIGIYKFIVAEDMETIVYYAYYTGVTFNSFSRDTFSNATFSDGIAYSIDCKCAFIDDMNPLILTTFNSIGEEYRNANSDTTTELLSYDLYHKAISAYVSINEAITDPMTGNTRYVDKLKWRYKK